MSTAELREQRLGGLRWIVVSGPGAECFRALGEHMREEISYAVTDWPLIHRLRRHVAGEPGRGWLASVWAATQAAHPAEWAELTALAAGAGVAVADLALLNFRGDLGVVEGGSAAAIWPGGAAGRSSRTTRTSPARWPDCVPC